ncbi:MAG: hypothetical protein M3Z10_11010 [Gemmatimonadota bacterium]|nr:hypothetical protein [Gemmatimonadota bacterium]
MSPRPVVAAVAAILLAATHASAQSIPNINAPKQAAQRAVAAENAQLSAQTGQVVPTRAAAAPAPAPAAPISGPAAGAAGLAASARRTGPGLPAMQPAQILPQVTREVFMYDAGGRRDPFFSLILTEDLRPLLSDLKLVGVLYDATQRRSVAIFRDVLTNAQYRVGTGMPLGRMRVAQIKPRGVIFTIDEFGLSRQDSLMLQDNDRARIK